MTKILIIRFSSIGDIVLTTPVIRCLKKQYKDAEIHYATKKTFNRILENNHYVDKLHLLEENLSDLVHQLKQENFDYIIDLHNNLRTTIIKLRLRKKSFSFNKLNLQKFILTTFKMNYLPKIHIVDRYLDTIKSLGVKNDGQGLDYFIPKKDEVNLIENGFPETYIGLVIGAKFATKRLPFNKILELIKLVDFPIILLGGPEDVEISKKLIQNSKHKNLYNACGKFNLNQSASLVKQAKQIITHDTGLMHIASAFNKNIITIWGNTVPQLGMYPYVSKDKSTIVEVSNLKCRPCSKIGFDSCPKHHFDCMQKIDLHKVISSLK